MTPDQIRSSLLDIPRTPDGVFELVRAVAYYRQQPESDLVEGLDLIIRVLDKRQGLEALLQGVNRMIDAIARDAGLYPYVEGGGGWRDELAVEVMRAPGLRDIIFHLEQAIVFNRLAQGRSIILSAPTSFGKSLLIDVLIAQKSPDTVVAVVPTIALLDEFRRRMEKRFPIYQVITRSSEKRTNTKAIFIGTQERLLERREIGEIDLFIIDEFYKLDLDRGDERSLALNTALAKYGRTSKQIYLLGPSIDEVPHVETYREDLDFFKTRFSPVTADVIDRTAEGPSAKALLRDLEDVRGSSSLIYVQSPPSAARLTHRLLERLPESQSSLCRDMGDWLLENFHPEWIVGHSVKQGVGIHHGRVPRSIAHLMVALFNRRDLPMLVCTSSMIEGVNTAAENVFIYDKNISTKKLDRFTFDNIKGRAGRMFQHKIGRIYLYNPPPEETTYSVKVPIFDSDETLVPELLVQLDDGLLTDGAQQRKRLITDASALPSWILAKWAGFGIDELNTVAAYVEEELSRPSSLIVWDQAMPSFEELAASFEVVWNTLRFKKHDIRSARQLAFYANRLRGSRSIREYLDGLVDATGLAAQPQLDRCFNFIRGAEFTFPQVLLALHDIINYLGGGGRVNYQIYAGTLQNLFLPGELRALDELGVPLPVLRRISKVLPRNNVNAARKLLGVPSSRARQMLSNLEEHLVRVGLDLPA